MAARRGRSANAEVYNAVLSTKSGGVTFHAHGLRSGCDEFKPGDFIGLYTGRWGVGVAEASRRRERVYARMRR